MVFQISKFEGSTVSESITKHDQKDERINTDTTRKEVDSFVMAVERRVHDAILTAMYNVVVPKVEMAVRSKIGSSGRAP